MPSEFRGHKTLPNWLQLDYYRRRRRLWRWRSGLTWAVFLGGTALMAVFLAVPWTNTFYQAGPVSPSHAMFNNDCSQCHKENFSTARRLWPFGHPVVAVPDDACQRCHEGALHYPGQPAETHTCGSCHQEHRGRAALALVPDNACLVCHKDLKGHEQGLPEAARKLLAAQYAGRTFRDVTSSFPQGHPEFGVWDARDTARVAKDDQGSSEPKDRANLRFTHAKHLQEGGVLMPREALPKELPPGWTVTEDQKHVRLDCAACHQPDADGRYMKPINYDTHCSQCHPLGVRLAGGLPDDAPEGLKDVWEEFAAKPAPHKEPRIIQAVLRDRLIAFIQKNKLVPAPMEEGLQGPLRPGPAPLLVGEWELANRGLTAAEEVLFVNRQLPPIQGGTFVNCTFCHIEKDPGKREQGLPAFEETHVPERWLPHSFFSHVRHRMLACKDCHPGVEESELTSDVLMPKVAACAQCHNARVGVRHDCSECHTYHDKRHGYGDHKDIPIDSILHP